MEFLIWIIGWGIVTGMIWQGKDKGDSIMFTILFTVLCLFFWPLILGAEIERGIDRG
jgi:succinate-acetate transporter protein